jgi:hypothetical protein
MSKSNLTKALDALKAVDQASTLGLDPETERFGLNEGLDLPKISTVRKIMSCSGDFRDPYCLLAFFQTIAWFANEGLVPPNPGDSNWPNFIKKIKAKLIGILPENSQSPWLEENFRNEQFELISKIKPKKQSDSIKAVANQPSVLKAQGKEDMNDSNLNDNGLPSDVVNTAGTKSSNGEDNTSLSDSEEESNNEEEGFDLQTEGLFLKPMSTTVLKKSKKGKTITQQNVVMCADDDITEQLDDLATDFFRLPTSGINGKEEETTPQLMEESEIVSTLKANYVSVKQSKGSKIDSDFITDEKFLNTMTQVHVVDNFRYICKFKSFFSYLFWLLYPFTYLNRMIVITQGAFSSKEEVERENKNSSLFTFFNDSIIKLSNSLKIEDDPIELEEGEESIEESEDDVPFISEESDCTRSITDFLMVKQFLDYMHSLHFQKNTMSVQGLNSMVRAAISSLYPHVKENSLGPLLKTFWVEVNSHNTQPMSKYYKALKTSVKDLYLRFVTSEMDLLTSFKYLQATVITVNKKKQTFLLRLYASDQVSNEIKLSRQDLFSQKVLRSCYNLKPDSLLDDDVITKLIKGQAKLEKSISESKKTNLSILNTLQLNANRISKKPSLNKTKDLNKMTKAELLEYIKKGSNKSSMKVTKDSKSIRKLSDFTEIYKSGTVVLPETEQDLVKKLGILSENLSSNKNYVTLNNVVYYNIPKGYRKKTDPQYTACLNNLKAPNKALVTAVSKIRKKTGL